MTITKKQALKLGGLFLTTAMMAACGEVKQPTTGGTNNNPTTDKVATPTFNPASGATFTSTQTVTISDATAGAIIHCTTDGSVATAASPVCTTVSVDKTETINAMATKSGLTDSDNNAAAYIVSAPATPKVATPTFNPDSGNYTAVQTETISDATPGATIYYTVDGSTPTNASTKYTGPFTVASSETIKAIGTETGYNQSDVGAAALNITLPVNPCPTSGTDSANSLLIAKQAVAAHASGDYSTLISTLNGVLQGSGVTLTNYDSSNNPVPGYTVSTDANSSRFTISFQANPVVSVPQPNNTGEKTSFSKLALWVDASGKDFDGNKEAAGYALVGFYAFQDSGTAPNAQVSGRMPLPAGNPMLAAEAALNTYFGPTANTPAATGNDACKTFDITPAYSSGANPVAPAVSTGSLWEQSKNEPAFKDVKPRLSLGMVAANGNFQTGIFNNTLADARKPAYTVVLPQVVMGM